MPIWSVEPSPTEIFRARMINRPRMPRPVEVVKETPEQEPISREKALEKLKAGSDQRLKKSRGRWKTGSVRHSAEWVTTAEAGEILGYRMTATTIRELDKRGVKAEKFTTGNLYFREDVERAKEERDEAALDETKDPEYGIEYCGFVWPDQRTLDRFKDIRHRKVAFPLFDPWNRSEAKTATPISVDWDSLDIGTAREADRGASEPVDPLNFAKLREAFKNMTWREKRIWFPVLFRWHRRPFQRPAFKYLETLEDCE